MVLHMEKTEEQKRLKRIANLIGEAELYGGAIKIWKEKVEDYYKEKSHIKRN